MCNYYLLLCNIARIPTIIGRKHMPPQILFKFEVCLNLPHRNLTVQLVQCPHRDASVVTHEPDRRYRMMAGTRPSQEATTVDNWSVSHLQESPFPTQPESPVSLTIQYIRRLSFNPMARFRRWIDDAL